MRKTELLLFTLSIVCACSGGGQAKPDQLSVKFTAKVRDISESTKVVLGEAVEGKYPCRWSINDKEMEVSLNLSDPVIGYVTPAQDGSTAEITATFPSASTVEAKLYALSPISSCMYFSEGRWNFSIPEEQSPSASSPDENAVVVMGESEKYSSLPASFSIPFRHITAYGRVNLINLELDGASVISLSITAEREICGQWTLSAATGEIAQLNASKTINISTSTVSGIWFGCAPASLGGTDLKISVNTTEGALFKTVTLPSVCDFTAGKVQPLTIDMEGVHFKKTACRGWFELPAQSDVNHDGIDDKNIDLYYSWTMRADAAAKRNFSACYSKGKIHPVWVAAPMHSCYLGSSGRNDAYQDDPAIKCDQSAKFVGYTRGHMIGSSERTVSVATNRQVFYYSNIGAQLSSGFNTGGGAWNNLENLVDANYCPDTLYQVVGCIFETWTDQYDKTVSKQTATNGAGDTFQVPTAWYKVLLRTKKGNSGKRVDKCTADELQCVAFILSHRSNSNHQPSEKDMYKVTEVEKLTGLEFFVNVPNAPKDNFKASDWL